jgi:hypothetical protein
MSAKRMTPIHYIPTQTNFNVGQLNLEVPGGGRLMEEK